MLPSWYVPACVVLTLLIIITMVVVLHRERTAKDEKWKRTCFIKGALITYPPMTDREWADLEDRLKRQREFDRLVAVVEEAREDFTA